MDNIEYEGNHASLCTCGQSPASEQSTQPPYGSSNPRRNVSTNTNMLESSFVHLTTPRKSLHGSAPGRSFQAQHGYLEKYQHMQQLLTAASVYDSDIPLCKECIDRVAAALEADTYRLQEETKAYKNEVLDSEQRVKTFDSVSKISIHETEKAYENEIDILQQEVENREAELAHLYSLYEGQVAITSELEEIENQAYQDLNSLELQSKSFDDSAKLLSKTLSTIQSEVDQLSIVRLPLSLFDLQVDEKGRRYPLINQLRLAFKPKGDASEEEIRAAWSQATQLLLSLGTLLQFSSSEWKLVPLADCAKLIYRKEIFNLKPGDCRSLMAWNALLDKIIRHAKVVLTPPIDPCPYPSSPSSIGNTELARLDRTDQVSWSKVIHRMASNLLWLSERVSEHVAFQVSSLAHSCV